MRHYRHHVFAAAKRVSHLPRKNICSIATHDHSAMSKRKAASAKSQSSISKYFTEKPTIKAPKVTKDEEKTEKELESAKKIQDQLDKFKSTAPPQKSSAARKRGRSEDDDDVSPPPAKKAKKAVVVDSAIMQKLSGLTRDDERHERFVKKLASWTEAEVNGDGDDDDDEGSGSEGEGDDEEEEKPKSKAKPAAKKAAGKKSKYTPLETQYLEMKKKCPDAILFVEAGYRYKFFGEDAEIAARVLGIHAHFQHNFLSTSIPVHRLPVHVKKLVSCGYKVGVVSQMETAALKAVSSKKSGPFKRDLTGLYTKATLTGNLMDPLSSDEGSYANYLVCIYEEADSDLAEEVTFGLMAVQSNTGDIIYDCFKDNVTRNELDTRLQHIQPVEIIVPEKMTIASERLLRNFTRTRVKEDSIRLERLSAEKFDEDNATSLIDHLKYKMEHDLEIEVPVAKDEDEMSDIEDDDKVLKLQMSKEQAAKTTTALESILKTQPAPMKLCLGALVNYLHDFGLDTLFYLDCNFRHFTHVDFMKIDGTALSNLELLRNQSNNTERGSLLWVLDHTSTMFGRRLLINWIKQPLIDRNKIIERLDAVEEIHQEFNETLTKLVKLLKKLPDLERGICRIYYKRCSIQEFVAVLQAYKTVLEALPTGDQLEEINSTLLKNLFSEMPDVSKDVEYFLGAINFESLKTAKAEPNSNSPKENMSAFLNDKFFPKMTEAKKHIQEIEANLQTHLFEVRKVVRDFALDYVTKLGTEYLIEVKKTQASKIPNDWAYMGGTKVLSRYHTPYIKEQVALLNQWRETLALESENAWTNFLSTFASKYTKFSSIMRKLAVFDCLASLAYVARQQNYTRPEITEEHCFEVEEGRHPIVEALINEPFVPNGIEFKEDGQKCVIVTGPNMGGKSCFARQVALIAIMAQIGSFVSASRVKLSPLDAVYTRMGAADNMAKGASTFFVELQETGRVLAQATKNSLVILDELGRGTSTHDGVAIAHAVLWYIIEQLKCYTVFITHYPSLSQFEQKYPHNVANYHMAFLEQNAEHKDEEEDKNPFNEDEEPPQVTFLHRIERGVQKKSYGLNVALLAKLPREVVKRAYQFSKQLEHRVRHHQLSHNFKLCYKLLTAAAGQSNEKLLKTNATKLMDRFKEM